MSTRHNKVRTPTQRIGEFAHSLKLQDVPGEVITKLKTTLLHDIGMVLAGYPISGVALNLAKTVGASTDPNAPRLLVDGGRVHADYAVLANAAMMHARTQDDTHLTAQTHLGSTTLSPLLAVAEERDASGADFLVAMLAAYESSAIAEGAADGVTARGFRSSTVFGPLCAAVGVSKLLGLDAAQIANAIGLAASFGGGIGQTWISGTEEWQYQLGNAGRNGLLAARLAAVGVRGAPDALEGAAGLYTAFSGVTDPAGARLATLGKRWETLEVTYKPFPICAINQLPATLASTMVRVLDVKAEEIDEVILRLPPSHATYPGTESYAPFSGVGAALMSAPHCLALALRDGTVTRASLETFNEPGITALAVKIKVVADDGLLPGQCHITVRQGGSMMTSDQIPHPRGFGWDSIETLSRLHDMEAELPLDGARIDALAELIFDLENRSVAELVTATLA